MAKNSFLRGVRCDSPKIEFPELLGWNGFACFAGLLVNESFLFSDRQFTAGVRCVISMKHPKNREQLKPLWLCLEQLANQFKLLSFVKGATKTEAN